MKIIYLLCFIISFGIGFACTNPHRPTIAAFVRVKNEIKTIIPCLESIDGVFDKIIIIHSNEPDDGSIKVMNNWCQKRKACHIYEYPHAVIPSHTQNQKRIKYENSLAAYYNFGLEKFEPDDYVVKIDADQIYITPHLKQTFDFIRMRDAENDFVLYGIKGYNTFSHKGRLVKYAGGQMNGGFDSFIIKRKYMKKFINLIYYETLSYHSDIKSKLIGGSHWFHFMKTLKNKGKTRPTDTAKESEMVPLTQREQQEFETYIRPLLEKYQSPYKNLSF